MTIIDLAIFALVIFTYAFLCSIFWVGAGTAAWISLTIVAAPIVAAYTAWFALWAYTKLMTRFAKTKAPV